MPSAFSYLLLDANVLIDNRESDLTIFERTARHIGPVCVVSTVLDDVKALDEADRVTNDRRLRRACHDHDVRVAWGLELMVHLERRSPGESMRPLDTGGHQRGLAVLKNRVFHA